MTRLSHYDLAVIGFYFIFMLVIGWRCRRFIRDTGDYFRGGGKMLWWMAGSSAFMVQFSAWTFTGAAGKAYEDGPVVLVLFIANAAGFFLSFVWFAPRFRQMRVVTSMQAVRERFGPASEQFFTWLRIPIGVLSAGIWLYALCIFIAAAFGADLWITIIVTGGVVVVMSTAGGSWAVTAGDFIQMLFLMPVSVIAAALALKQVGGPPAFLEKLPEHFHDATRLTRPEILWLWVTAMFIKQFASTNSIAEASRYLNTKDGSQARRAALLACILFILGPLVWFIPPMVARMTHLDLAGTFPNLNHPNDAAFVASCMNTLPAGLMGLVISGMFGATMSSMDSGLNAGAGFFVKNFYQPVLRRNAGEPELLSAGKIATLVLGLLVILAALAFSTSGDMKLFDLMQRLGAFIALPYAVPLIWGMLVKRAPQWAGWTAVLAGFASSLLVNHLFTADWPAKTLGWPPLNPREASDWAVLASVLVNVLVGSAWFLGCCCFHKQRSHEEIIRVGGFFEQMEKPVDFQREIGESNDVQQYRLLGGLCLACGGFIALLVLIPNPPAGRMAIAACAAMILAVGVLLRLHAGRTRDNSR